MMLTPKLAGFALVLTACFHPNYEHPQCGPDGDCPSGFRCGADNVCVSNSLPIDGGIAGDAGPAGDAFLPIDSAPLDGSLAPICLGTFDRICVDPPTGNVDLPTGGTTTLNTDSSPLCVAYTATPTIEACVIAGKRVDVPSGNVHITGHRKLILLATQSIDVTGTLDVASHVNAASGPASGRDACNAGRAPTSLTEGGGGYGGSFGTLGGSGGQAVSGASGGMPGAVITALTGLRAGCAGSPGAIMGPVIVGGPGGAGGGAVYAIAADTITINGALDASGGGGGGTSAGSQAGGGGGGSGGMIVLEAATVTLAGQCYANGGCGGEGASNTVAGESGKDARSPSDPGLGGGDTNLNGNGGKGGGNNPAVSGQGGGPNQGGGGGGGGAGVIKVIAGTTTGFDNPNKVSPLPTITMP